jgi:hypothetical protein
MSPYYMKIAYRTNIGVVIYLALAWVFGRLSWPLVGFAFVFWLLLPFSVIWSWPENRDPVWWRVLSLSQIKSVRIDGAVRQAWVELRCARRTE